MFSVSSRSTAKYTYTACYNHGETGETKEDHISTHTSVPSGTRPFDPDVMLARHTSTCIASTIAARPFETSRIIRLIDEVFLGAVAGVVVFGP